MPLRNIAMYEFLYDFTQRPEPFSRYTADELWTRPYLARQMLKFHLDQNSDLASRKTISIEKIVDWIDTELEISGKTLCDLGCGPGLYAQRFFEKGANVTGVDFSANSIEYAKSHAEKASLPINYINADYLSDALPDALDIVTMIYCDFCVLSPTQRGALLLRMAGMLCAGGHLAIDVAGVAALKHKTETTLIEKQLMNGFWADGDYIGMQHSYIYPEILLSLDRYLIVEPGESWEIFNWFQHFTPLSIESELNQAGFEIEQMSESLTGEKLRPDSEVIGIIARKK